MKITYETHYKSTREDGRHTSTMASFLAYLRNVKPILQFDDSITAEGFSKWQGNLREKVRELLLKYPVTEQPAPKLLSVAAREGYRVEKWEFYPDDYTAVPFLILIPDGVTKDNKAPGVMCFPGSTHSKELLAGEKLIDQPKCRCSKYPDRNKMAYHIVKNGMIAFAFDNPETCECALDIEREPDYGYTSRIQLCHGLIQSGFSYIGISLFQKLRALDFIKTLDYLDVSRIGVSAHSMGCDDAVYIALLSDDIKAVVFNDFACDEIHRYYSTTEYDERRMANHIGQWHEIPESFRYYARPDILCALAPKYLSLNEGGSEFCLNKIRSAYALTGNRDKLFVNYYPKYASPEPRIKDIEPKMYGYSEESYFEYANVDAPDHSYRAEASMEFLRKVFF